MVSVRDRLTLRVKEQGQDGMLQGVRVRVSVQVSSVTGGGRNDTARSRT